MTYLFYYYNCNAAVKYWVDICPAVALFAKQARKHRPTMLCSIYCTSTAGKIGRYNNITRADIKVITLIS